MDAVTYWDPQNVAERANSRWTRLEARIRDGWTRDDWEDWNRLGEELLELSRRLEWLGLYRTP